MSRSYESLMTVLARQFGQDVVRMHSLSCGKKPLGVVAMNNYFNSMAAWRSDRKHLNLFAASSGKSFLIQGGRLAAYLQAGLLLPQEEETLTVRATRDALSKIDANPERLMA